MDEFNFFRELAHELNNSIHYTVFGCIFSTCWLIVGACYVYSTYEIVTHHVLEDENYCEYTAYTFAFIVITIGFISLVLSVIAALCACVCRSSSDEE